MEMPTKRGDPPCPPWPVIVKNTFLHIKVVKECGSDSSGGCQGDDRRNAHSDSEASSRTSRSSSASRPSSDWRKADQSGGSGASSGNLGGIISASGRCVEQLRSQNDRSPGSGESQKADAAEEQGGRCCLPEQLRGVQDAAATASSLSPSNPLLKKVKRPGKDKREHLKRVAALAAQEAAQDLLKDTKQVIESQSSLSSKLYLAKLVGAKLQDPSPDAKAKAPGNNDALPAKPGLLSL